MDKPILRLYGCMALLVSVLIACAPVEVHLTPISTHPHASTAQPRQVEIVPDEDLVPATLTAPPVPAPTATGPIVLGTDRLDPLQIGTAIPREITKVAPEQITLDHIREDPNHYRDQLVLVKGLGVIMATIPLCEGHVGPDRRTLFLDPDEDSIVATTAEAAQGDYGYRQGEDRLFSGYLRVYRGPVGCPGETSVQTIFYLELVSVR